MKTPRRILYVTGPGDVISAHRSWRRGEPVPTEVSITFSSQVEDACDRVGAETLVIAAGPREELRDGRFRLVRRPRLMPKAHGALYHVAQVLNGLRLLASALRFRAQVAIVDSGATHPFVLLSWRLCGIRIIPVMHNTLWPAGNPPAQAVQRLVLWLDARLFWRRVPLATLCVSPECARQVEAITGGRSPPRVQVRAQFRPGQFQAVGPPPPHGKRPFRIVFVGRVARFKGVMDLLEMARTLEDRSPGEYQWEVCGSGPDLEAVRQRHLQLRLGGVVVLHGRVEFAEQIAIYARSHVSIVPTRSDFAEGLAMTVAEAVLAGRPVITSAVVPALEVLRPACVEARTDDVASYVGGLERLAGDAELYERLCRACPAAAAPFTDPSQGLAAALERVLLAGGA